ncbi:MAG: 5-oxoprolinase subunit PxpA [Sulfurovum sp.]|jgi:UPF0271 protein
MKVYLNCDMGESFGIYNIGNDEKIIPHIDMANLACGFHASDSLNINKSVKLVASNNKIIGAHPSYQDLVGFGRRSMICSYEEIYSLVLYQIGALSAFCKVHNTKVSYVKPHGALYNDMMKDENIFKAILDAISSYDKKIKLMVLSSSKNESYKNIASIFNIDLIFELFADRNYTDEGFLVSRNEKNSVIHDNTEVKNRLDTYKNDGYILSESGKKLYLEVDTICIHGDNENALDFAKLIKSSIA